MSVNRQQFRIIAGQWRSRKFSFPDLPDLRPTPDRVRETLFNWLAPYISGARCLDLYAGSGALGMEALSRGAAFVEFVDHSQQVIKQINQNLALVNCSSANCVVASASLIKPASIIDFMILSVLLRELGRFVSGE